MTTICRVSVLRRVPFLLPALILACGDTEAVVEAPPPVPTTLAITPPSAVLASLGQTVQLTATVRDQTGTPMTGVALNWASSDGGIVTVDASGVVTAVGNGAANVTATVRGGGASGSAAIAVEQQVAEVRLTPDPQVLRALGETFQMSAEVLDANGHPVPGATVGWASDDESVVTVSSSGLVTAVGNGSATVSASSDPVSATVDFTVEQEAASLTVSPDSAVLGPQETLRLTADVRDANGNAVTDADVTWLSDDESVATVDAAGLVTGVRPGSAGISAQLPASGLIASARIVVQNADRAALVALYNATGGPIWTNSENWLTDQPIGTWSGVVTDVEGRVTSLNLQVNGMVGRLPDELRYLTGLHTLNLSANSLSGTLPPYLAEFADLEELNLASNHLSGPIPSELSNLARLRSLRLHGNGLSGSIPPELGRLANLEDLGLSENRLTGTIPVNLGNLSRLNELRLHGNALSGPIPTNLGRLAHLRLLSLCCNQLTGEIPDELGALSLLTFLGLHHNQLSGPVPHELGGLHRLQRLYLGSNEQLTGPLPQQFVHLPLQVFNWVYTGLCSPANDRFQEWLAGIERHEGEGVCSSSAP